MATQAETVLLRLREMIMQGRFAPGEHLMEIPLAETLQVSRTPVRWALGTLAQEGLLIYTPQRGFVVRGYTVKEITDAVAARGAIEAMACATLAEIGLTPEQQSRLESNLAHTEALTRHDALTPDHVERWCELNAEFHSAIVDACGNEIVRSFFHQVNKIPLVAPRSIAATTGNLGRIAKVIQRGLLMHDAIFDALRRRQPHRAEALMREHVYQGKESLRAHLEAIAAGQQADFQAIPLLAKVADAPVARRNRRRSLPA